MLLDARGENERVALRVHVQARGRARSHRGQNFGLEEGCTQFDKERSAAHDAVVKVDSDIEADKVREDENTEDGVRRRDGAQGGSETFVVGYGIEDESRRHWFGHRIGRLRVEEHFTKSHVLPATTVGDDVYKSAPEARTLVLFVLKEFNDWEHSRIEM